MAFYLSTNLIIKPDLRLLVPNQARYRLGPDRRETCWKCGEKGHMRRAQRPAQVFHIYRQGQQGHNYNYKFQES